ncbi:MAG: hypothetical protein JW943_13565 [Deltaproteobacteria bacterium]|nr:hypothetical protein [Deltaproteobacteria bacterium]
MDEKKDAKKLSMSSTKQEMLEAYGALVKQLQEKREAELRPEKKLEEKKAKEAVKTAESVTADGVVRQIGDLKIEIGNALSGISAKIEAEVIRLETIQQAISAKDREIQELYEIEKSAVALAALIEAQNQKRQEFTADMEEKKAALAKEIESTRDQWEKEKEDYEAAIKERDESEKKRQTRIKDEFDYTFKREQQLAADRFAYEKAKLEKELKDKKETLENELRSREENVAEKEEEFDELRKRTSNFPKELEAAVSKAVKEATERISLEAKSREELLKKQYEGESNVFKARIESLEKTVKEQNERLTFLSQQLEAAYQKVQDIAVKTVEGASSSKTIANLQQLLGEQARKQGGDK